MTADITHTRSAAAFRNVTGFTVIELMTVVTIVGILMAIGVPSYRYVTNSNRLSAEVNGLLGDLQFARSEALKEGQTVSVCISSNQISCATGSPSWDNGWIVFSDPTGGAAVDGKSTILRVQKGFSSTDKFQNNNVIAVTFNREGFANNLGTANVTLTLHDKTSSKNWTRCLSMTPTGAMKIDSNITAPSTCI
jgi:type IV fimbrial biogenesis protein FimT